MDSSRTGGTESVVINAGYLEGRDLPPDQELLEYIPTELFDTAQHIASRGPFLVAKASLPAMRKQGRGSFLITTTLHPFAVVSAAPDRASTTHGS